MQALAPRDADPQDPFVSLAGLAVAYRSGAARPSDVVAAHLERIARRDGDIGAFEAVYADEAMAAAEAADKAIASGHRIGPFHGVPFGLKDICELEGRVTTWGSKALEGRRSAETGAVARRLIAAGGVLLGKTKTVEFAFGGWGTNQRMGTPRNPWDRRTHRAPGGSSSGSAAAVAAGLAVCAVGTDTGRSVRVPASFCGLAGLKTTWGRLPLDGIMPLSGALDTPGPMARSALDALLMVDVMSGREGWAMDRDWLGGRGDYGALSMGVAGLRLATIGEEDRAASAPEVLARYDAALETLRGLGATLAPLSPPKSFAELAEACGRIIAAECYANHRTLIDDPAAPLDEDVRARTTVARSLSAADYQSLFETRRRDTVAFLAAFAGFDAYLTPTTPIPAPPVATIDQSRPVHAPVQLPLDVRLLDALRPRRRRAADRTADRRARRRRDHDAAHRRRRRGGLGADAPTRRFLKRGADASTLPHWLHSLTLKGATMTDATSLSAQGAPTEPCDLSAVALRRLIGAKALSPVELMESCLRRVAAANPAVNAVVKLDEEGGLAAAREAEATAMSGAALGPLHGLPIALKDSQATRGMRTTYGSLLHKDDVPAEDQPSVARLRAAGAAIFAKTNLPEFGAGGNTVNRVFGATCNPFDLAKTSGGSSGGAAAALATGMAPLATGSDYGGSLRTPAAFCGVVGFRPSMGVAPSAEAASYLSPWGVEGPMARSVADAHLLLSAQTSYDGADPFSSPSVEAVREPIAPADLATLKIAVSPDLGAAPVAAEIRSVFADRVERIAPLVGSLVEAHPDMGDIHKVFDVTRGLAFVSSHRERLERHRGLLDRNVIDNVEHGLRYDLADVAWAHVEQAKIYRRWRAFFDECDALILPSASVSPFPHAQLFVDAIDGAPMESYMRWLALSYATTIAFAPVATIPCGVDRQGMPFGVMIAGRRGDDRKILTIAAALEAAFAASPETARPVPDLERLARASSAAESA